MLKIVFRTALVYTGLIAAIRLLGKRQLGELEVSELVTTLVVSELAVAPVSNPDIPLWRGIVPVAVLIMLEVAISRLMLRSATLDRFFGGTPAILIRNGKICVEEITKNRIGVSELMSSLRQEGYAAPEDVAYAILETNGKLSVIPTVSAAPPSAEDHGIKKAERGIAHSVIVDGKANERGLKQAGRDRDWLSGVLKQKHIKEKDVLLLTVDDAGKVWYQLRGR